MTAPDLAVHYLRPAAADWSPDAVLTFRVASRERPIPEGIELRPQAWAARLRLRHQPASHRDKVTDFMGLDVKHLTMLVDRLGSTHDELWCLAYNMGSDLALTALPEALCWKGWAFVSCYLGQEANYWVLAQDGRRLVVTDTWSWLRSDLTDIAKDLKRRLYKLPPGPVGSDHYAALARSQCDILDRSMSQVMDWWDGAELGRFGVTGAGCAWSALRRRLPEKTLCTGPGPVRTPWERGAVYGGRREVYRVGRFSGTNVADYDFVNAYTVLAGYHALPKAPASQFEGDPPSAAWDDDAGWDMIADAVIETDAPIVPARIGADVWWPTGRFQARLPGPELRWAVEAGAKVTVLGGWWYRMTYNLREHSWWLQDLLGAPAGTVPAPVRRMAKGWQRSTWGRMATRTTEVVRTEPATHLGWHLETGQDLATGTPLDRLTVGGTTYVLAKDVEPSNGSVAVWAFLESYCRVALAKMLATRDPGRVLACDTDGWLERRATGKAVWQMPDVPLPLKVVRKSLWREVTISGPSNLVTAHQVRHPGIRKDATPAGDGTFVWHDQPSLRWQLERAALGTYLQPKVTAHVQAHYAKRWVLIDGRTLPVRVGTGSDGTNRIVPFAEAGYGVSADDLTPVQDPALEALRS